MGGPQAARVLSTVGGDFADGRRARRLRGTDPRDVRARGLPVLRDGAAVGRRGHRPARHAARPDDGHRGGAPRADPGDALRRLPDVKRSSSFVATVALAGCGIAGLRAAPPAGRTRSACADLGFGDTAMRVDGRAGQVPVGRLSPVEAYRDRHPAADDTTAARIGGYMISRVRFHLATGTERTEEIWCIGVRRRRRRSLQQRSDHRHRGRRRRTTMFRAPATRPLAARRCRPRPAPGEPWRWPGRSASRCSISRSTTSGRTGSRSARPACRMAPLPRARHRSSTMRPESFWIRDARLEIEPVDRTRPPIGNIYREPFDGVERVTGHPRVRRHRVQSGCGPAGPRHRRRVGTPSRRRSRSDRWFGAYVADIRRARRRAVMPIPVASGHAACRPPEHRAGPESRARDARRDRSDARRGRRGSPLLRHRCRRSPGRPADVGRDGPGRVVDEPGRHDAAADLPGRIGGRGRRRSSTARSKPTSTAGRRRDTSSRDRGPRRCRTSSGARSASSAAIGSAGPGRRIRPRWSATDRWTRSAQCSVSATSTPGGSAC